jgi:hypothetical protein
MIKSGIADVVYSDIFGKAVTYDDYQNLYNDYLKKGGTPLQVFNLENLDKVLGVLNN